MSSLRQIRLAMLPRKLTSFSVAYYSPGSQSDLSSIPNLTITDAYGPLGILWAISLVYEGKNASVSGCLKLLNVWSDDQSVAAHVNEAALFLPPFTNLKSSFPIGR